MTLDEIRVQIDEIDRELVPLIKRRMECSLAVAEIKKQENLPIYHPEREKQILDRVEQTVGEEYGHFVSSIYKKIMSVSRSFQGNELNRNSDFAKRLSSLPTACEYTKVFCQGAEGSFSHAAAEKMFPDKKPQFFTEFEEVFKAVENDDTAVGILPVENSTAGSVDSVYDLILKYNHCIVKAIQLDVSQNLLSIGSAEDVKIVYSHPHALKQCENYIKQNGLKAVEFENTALAAKYVAELRDPTVAAIGSTAAANVYDLNVSKKAIQNQSNNVTRFIAVSKKAIVLPDSNTVSVAFTVPHEKGSLYSILGRFADNGMNLTKIESRPMGHDFEYKFYMDFSGNIKDDHTLNLLASIESELSYFVFLGNYPEIARGN